MSTHVADELPSMLTGEATRHTVLAAAEHLRGCVDCQHALVSAVVAHASLTSAQRFAPEIMQRSTADHFSPDSEHETVADHELPDLSAVFAQVREEAAEQRPGRSSRRPLAIAAAAVVVAAGAGIGIYAATSSGSGSTGGSRTVALSAFDKGHTSATATIGDGTIRLDATTLPKVSAQRYEVWLTDRARTRMQPIGWIGNNGTAVLTVPSEMMSQFDDLEVSVQKSSAENYTYSGTSVLRGPIS
jgi:hypothetical protein